MGPVSADPSLSLLLALSPFCVCEGSSVLVSLRRGCEHGKMEESKDASRGWDGAS
jgi:hypothetical protein